MTRMNGSAGSLRALALSAGLVTLAACNDRDQAPPMDMPMNGMDMPTEMEMDPAMMERHADEAESMATDVRTHVDAFRPLAPEEQQELISNHTAVIARTLGLLQRQMDEMSMGMPMDDEQMGAMMGMSAEEHRRMMEEMSTLRSEAEELQLASVEELRDHMPAHLDRLEAVAEMLEEMARAMRAM